MLKLILTAALAASSLCLSAQATFRGYVKDGKTQTPLPGATVVLQPIAGSAITDETGYFEIEVPSQETQTVTVRYLGYKTATIEYKPSTDRSVQEILLEEDVVLTDEVIVSSTRAADQGVTTFSSISKQALQKLNFGQDLPFILNWTPSLVTTSDAGAGVGYTGMRIRGSDATRINVTINGIPYNDSESQGTFWVDVPDIATSTQNIQVQRGVGTSTNGAGAFGASINLQTNAKNDKAYADVINSFGSFGTHRHTVGFGSGLINNKFVFDGRLSTILSDGYIDRASSNLKSYYLSGGYYGNKTMVKAIAFGGQEITYQSWNGVPESRLKNDATAMDETAGIEGWNAAQIANLTNSGRTFNMFLYENQVDNYTQNHYQLHVSHRFTDNVTGSVSGHFTHGFGYYEEYKYDDKFSNYGVASPVIGGTTVNRSDIIRRKWLDNNFFGTTWSLNHEAGKVNTVLGGAWNRYEGDHYGEILWTSVSAGIPKDHRYYFNDATKDDFNAYLKTTYTSDNGLSLYFDMQFRSIRYITSGIESKLNEFNINKNYKFVNPKVGATFKLNDTQQLYASYGFGHREPVRDDLVDAPAATIPKPEQLGDLEVGWRLRSATYAFNANIYRMNYRNQLVLTGDINDVGASLRTNVDKSSRTGIELEFNGRVIDQLSIGANLTLSQNKIEDFTEVLYDYGENYDEYNKIDRNYKNTDISFSPSVIAGSIISYRIIKGLELSLLSKYVGKQYLDNTSNKQRQIDAYFINDLRLVWTLHPKSMREITVSLLANNIADARYVSNGYTYGYLGGSYEARQNYYFPQAGRNYMAMLALRF